MPARRRASIVVAWSTVKVTSLCECRLLLGPVKTIETSFCSWFVMDWAASGRCGVDAVPLTGS
jgi:hypothetical protein